MNKTTKWVLAAILTICGSMNVQAETLRGTVKDAITGEALMGATVRILELDNAAAVADIDGNYRITAVTPSRPTTSATSRA